MGGERLPLLGGCSFPSAPPSGATAAPPPSAYSSALRRPDFRPSLPQRFVAATRTHRGGKAKEGEGEKLGGDLLTIKSSLVVIEFSLHGVASSTGAVESSTHARTRAGALVLA